MSPNRIVALVTPLAALAAGACATWLAQHFPGVDIKQNDLQSVFIAGVVVVLAPAGQWLHGWQKHEARQADVTNAITLGTAVAAPAAAEAEEDTLPSELSGPFEELGGLGDVDDLSALDAFDDGLLDEDDLLPQTTG